MKNYTQYNSKKQYAFDIGNVLFHFDPSPIANLFVDLDIVKDIKSANEFLIDNFWHSQEIGLYNLKQSFYRLKPSLSSSKLQEIQDVWMGIFTPSLPMIEILEEIIGNGDEVALLSNIGPEHAIVARKCEVFKKCHQHFSCEIGARKPTRLFFQSFLLRYGWGASSMYFDDRQENINMGNEFHNGILFDLNNFSSDEEAAKKMRSYLSLDAGP